MTYVNIELVNLNSWPIIHITLHFNQYTILWPMTEMTNKLICIFVDGALGEGHLAYDWEAFRRAFKGEKLPASDMLFPKINA